MAKGDAAGWWAAAEGALGRRRAKGLNLLALDLARIEAAARDPDGPLAPLLAGFGGAGEAGAARLLAGLARLAELSGGTGAIPEAAAPAAEAPDWFPGFALEHREANGQRIRLRRGGEGPPLLLLHGNPQTHAMWHKVAPVLARRFTVVAPDIRGYGFSAAPPPTPDSRHYAKREMARDLVALMQGLGHERFRVASHDRGARVAHRLALDHPERVERLCVMDIVPTLEHFERADMGFALGYYHWFFLAQPHDRPERMILRDVEDWFDLHTAREPKDRGFFHPLARADYLAALREPGTVAAICEDYRAAIGIDLEHDRASRAAGERLRCPLLALWGAKGAIPRWYDPLAIWRGYAAGTVEGQAVDSGHYLAEEAPGEVLAALDRFL